MWCGVCMCWTGRFNIVQDHEVDLNVESERGFAQISKVGEELVEPNLLWVNAHSRDGSGPFLVSFCILHPDPKM